MIKYLRCRKLITEFKVCNKSTKFHTETANIG